MANVRFFYIFFYISRSDCVCFSFLVIKKCRNWNNVSLFSTFFQLRYKQPEDSAVAIENRCSRARINSAIFVSSEGKGFDSIEFIRRYGSQSVLCRKAKSAENINDEKKVRQFLLYFIFLLFYFWKRLKDTHESRKITRDDKKYLLWFCFSSHRLIFVEIFPFLHVRAEKSDQTKKFLYP